MPFPPNPLKGMGLHGTISVKALALSIDAMVLLFGLVFFAGFVDSIAGGGGLISLPAYLFVGLPPHLALGTNKLSSTVGTTFSMARFARGKAINLRVGVISAVFSMLGSIVGANLALLVPENTLRLVIAMLIPFAATGVLLGRKVGQRTTRTGISRDVLSAVVGFVIGTYDGFFGPGTGTFLIISYVLFVGMDEVTASGTAKVVNLASNVGALVTFVSSGRVYYALGLPAAIFGILGNWLGAGLALKKGAKIIRPLLVSVLALLFIKVVSDLVK